MTAEKLRHARPLMADRTRSIPSICKGLGDIPAPALHHHLHADGALKEPGRKRLAS